MRTALTALVLGALCAFGALIARPAPASAGSPDSASMTHRISLLDVFRPRAVNDLSGAAGAEGQALIQWTAPVSDDLARPKPDPVASYLVRVATFPASDLGGDTTAWFNAATPVAAPAPGNPGTAQSLLTSLEGGVTYYFGLRSVDAAGLTSIDDDKTRGVVTQVEVPVKGIAGVTNLTAVTGAATGSIDLVWSTPRRIGQFDPLVYEVRASTLGQISNPAEFAAAYPLTAFSPTPLPGVGQPGQTAAVTVTGLVPGATYFFAVRAADSGVPPFKGVWQRNPSAGLNPLNTAQAKFTAGRPDPVTDLTALPGLSVGDIRVTWSAPQNPNGVPLTQYIVKMSTKSVLDLGGDATAWFSLAGSTTFVKSPVGAPGKGETLDVTGLAQELGTLFYFGAKTVDMLGETSFIDLGASGGFQAKSRPRPIPPIINLTAVAVSTESGRIDLTWTAPDTTGMVPPLSYRLHVATASNLADNAAFDAAAPLSGFSASELPAVSSGTQSAMSVTGLVPLTTYYFALRVVDSNPNGSVFSDWTRSVSSGVNVNNFAAAPFVAANPDPVTDLTAIAHTDIRGAVHLTWTAPRNPNFVPVEAYRVNFATFSVGALAGDATGWFTATAASSTVVVSTAAPGEAVALHLTGLIDGELYFFGVRAIDRLTEISAVDHGADSAHPRAQASARANGVGAVTDLLAQPDGASGAVDLSWTTPFRQYTTLPERYVLRVSSTANMDDDAAFAAASPLSAFSGTPLPAVGAAGGRQLLTVTGLSPFTTYYFAVAVVDSSAPVNTLGHWLRDAQRNPNNFAAPSFAFREPDPVSDLTALPGTLNGELVLSWTAPRNQNMVPVSSYTVRGATFPVAALAGDATAWFNAATLSYVYYPAGVPGARESLTVTGLEPGAQYFFGLRAFDQIGEAGHLDAGLDPANPAPQVTGRPRGLGGLTDLVAKAGASNTAGIVDLTWTTPFRVLPSLPERYVVRASTTGQIADAAAFAAAQPLSAFTGSPVPAVGAGASRQTLTLTGLTPFVTYYFAVRVEDSSAPANNAGLWLRDTLVARNTANVTVPSFFLNNPEPVTDLVASQGTLEGEVNLAWTAPRNKNLMPISSYRVSYATVPVSALANDATAWLNLAAATTLSPAQAPGGRETLTVGGLSPLATFYFAVRSVDAVGETSFADVGADPSDPAVQASTKPKNLAPGVPSGFALAAGLKRATLSWNELPDGVTGAGKGLDFAFYRIQRSSDGVTYADISTGTALTLTDRPLRAETTYFYRLSARDQAGLESAAVTLSTKPFTLAPQDPFAITFSHTASSVTISWARTENFETAEPFFNIGAPASDELSGYQVWRSSGGAPFAPAFTYGVGVTTHVEADDGNSYQYRVYALNDYFKSAGEITFSPLGDQSVVLSDGLSKLVVPAEVVEALRAAVGTSASNVYIKSAFRTELNGGEVMQSVSFTPMRDGRTVVKNFSFPKPVKVVVGYQTDGGGNPTPATAASISARAAEVAAAGGARTAFASAEGGTVAAAPAAGGGEANLGMYWDDGKEYKKLYGAVDATNNTVSVQTPNVGTFQVRRLFRDSAATFDLSNITTRVITPNGDGKNDVMLMLFDNPNHAPVTGKIYDLRGAYVATMTPGIAPDTLKWDGMMGGKPVTSGVYIYQVEGDGKVFNGTCVVAR